MNARYQPLACVDGHHSSSSSSGSSNCSQDVEEGAGWCECDYVSGKKASRPEAPDEDSHAAARRLQLPIRRSSRSAGQEAPSMSPEASVDRHAVFCRLETLLGFEMFSSGFDSFILNQEGRGFAQRQFRIFKAWYYRQTTMENKAALESLVQSLDSTTLALHNIKMDGKSVLWSTAVELHAFVQISTHDGEGEEDDLISQRGRQEKALLQVLTRFLADDVETEFRKQDVNMFENLPGSAEDRARVTEFVHHLAELARNPVSFDEEALTEKFGEVRLGKAKSKALATINRKCDAPKSEISGTDCVIQLMVEKQQIKDPGQIFKAIGDDDTADIIRHALLLHLACVSTSRWWKESMMAKSLQIGLSQMAAEENYSAVVYMLKKAQALEKEIRKGDWTRQEKNEHVFPWLGLPLELLGPYVMAMKGDSSAMFTFVRAMQAVQSKVFPSFRAKLKRLEMIMQEQVTAGGNYMANIGATILSGASIVLFYLMGKFFEKSQLDEHFWAMLHATNAGAANTSRVPLADNSTPTL